MPTLEEVKKDRKAFSARDTYERFLEFCTAHNIEANELVLQTWDKNHNRSAIRNNYGTEGDILNLGLTTLYRRFLDNNCLRIPNGKPVVLPSGQKYQPTVRERRVVGGHAQHLRDITAKQMDIIRDQFRIEVRQLLRTQKFFTLSAGDIREIVLAALEETLAEKV